MEPMNCVAHMSWNGGEVWAPTQNPQGAFSQLPGGRLVRYIKRKLGTSLDLLKVNVTLMGGGFGWRLEVDYIGEAMQVSQAVGTPVQVAWTREDDIQHDFFHPLSYHYVSADLDHSARWRKLTRCIRIQSTTGSKPCWTKGQKSLTRMARWPSTSSVSPAWNSCWAKRKSNLPF
ncbi:MAG: molybdopterin-dependent oxidoreductase [Anaerolineales bacterium]|nr:molybdopterin-dependent oxidoreductase [Anaerolineales bacterium]